MRICFVDTTVLLLECYSRAGGWATACKYQLECIAGGYQRIQVRSSKSDDDEEEEEAQQGGREFVEGNE